MNPYDPEPSDLKEWVNTSPGSNSWPEQDWDLFVINGKNDELLIEYGNNENSPHQKFFIHALYHLVGDYYEWNREDEEILERIKSLLDRIDSDSVEALQKWKKETKLLLSDDLNFDLNYWIDHMFENQSDTDEN